MTEIGGFLIKNVETQFQHCILPLLLHNRNKIKTLLLLIHKQTFIHYRSNYTWGLWSVTKNYLNRQNKYSIQKMSLPVTANPSDSYPQQLRVNFIKMQVRVISLYPSPKLMNSYQWTLVVMNIQILTSFIDEYVNLLC